MELITLWNYCRCRLEMFCYVMFSTSSLNVFVFGLSGVHKSPKSSYVASPILLSRMATFIYALSTLLATRYSSILSVYNVHYSTASFLAPKEWGHQLISLPLLHPNILLLEISFTVTHTLIINTKKNIYTCKLTYRKTTEVN